jgi:hypothetical protein
LATTDFLAGALFAAFFRAGVAPLATTFLAVALLVAAAFPLTVALAAAFFAVVAFFAPQTRTDTLVLLSFYTAARQLPLS